MSFAVISASPDDAASIATTAEGALIGRDHELRWLTAGLRTAQRGAGSLVVIEGRPGIGKSHLVREARRRADAMDMQVLAARALESDRASDHSVLRRLGAAAFTGPASSPEGDLFRMVSSLATERPVLIAVDDVHLCDRASLHALLALALRLDDAGAVALLLARRCEAPECPDPAALEAVVADPAAVRIRLGPLDRDEAAAIVTAGLGRTICEEVADAVHELTAGNPFLVSELTLALAERGLDLRDAGPARLDGVAVPRVARSVRARAAGVSPEAIEALAAIAVLGDDAALASASSLAGRGYSETADLCGALVSAGILASYDPPRFAQPLLRTALYDSIAPADRLRLHREAAGVLASLGAARDVVAEHLLRSAPVGDAWAARGLRAAAVSARAAGRPGDSAAYLKRALAEGVQELEAELVRDLGMTAATLADVAAHHHLERALQLSETPFDRAAAALALARAEIARGAFAAARETCIYALGRPSDRRSEDLHSRLAAELSVVARLGGTVAPELERSPVASGAGADPDGVHALALHADAAARAGESSTAVAELARRAASGGRLFAEEGSLIPCLAVEALAASGYLREAEALWDAGLSAGERRGSLWSTATVRAHRAGTLLQLGCVERALTDARAAHEVLGHTAGPVSSSASAALAESLLEAGELDAAASVIGGAVARGGCFDGRLALASSRVRIAQRRYSDALADLERAASEFEACGVRNPALAPWRSLAAECHLAVGDVAHARALAAEELRLAEQSGIPAARARTLRVLGRTCGEADGLGHLREAVCILDDGEAQLELAGALLDLGEGLRRAGETVQARECLRRAMATAHRCGAALLAARARDALVLAGGRPRRPLHDGLDGLTPAERRIAALAASGLRNREIARELFVTVNTVSTHLRSVYRKLDITSRAQLPAQLARCEAGPEPLN